MASLHLHTVSVFICCIFVYGQVPFESSELSPNYQHPYFLTCPNKQIRDPEGRIVSPNYPGPLRPNICYQWSIFIEDGETLTLTFLKYNTTKRQKTCTEGFLEIGPVPHRRLCLSESRMPVVYESMRNLVWIKLVTGPLGTESGFVLEYIIGPQWERHCSPDKRQCSNGKCLPAHWFCNGFHECGGKDVSDEASCPATTIAPVPEHRCGPGRFLCISRLAREVECFEDYQRCDGVVNCLKAEDERRCDSRRLHCGGYTESAAGYITSPSYPDPYPRAKSCTWNIHVPAGRKIQIRFQSFDLSPQNPVTEMSDYVEFRDGRGHRAKLIGRYTEQRRPPSVVETTGDWLYVKFSTSLVGSDATGFNFTHQIKGLCLAGQEKCRDETDCFLSQEKCDGIWNCRRHGWDERGCANCDYDKFSCGRGGRCYSEQEHCNGRGTCFDNRDEKNCTPDQCNSGNGTFLCLNGRCIYESWVCDGTNDCVDDSDEKDCVSTPSIRVILAAVVGSLICGLLLVVALGCTLHMFAIRIQDQTTHYDTPMSRLQAELMRRAAPPSYNEAMQTSVPFTEMLTHMRAAGRRLSRGWRAPDIPTAPLNVAPLLANPGTRIPSEDANNGTTTNGEETGVTSNGIRLSDASTGDRMVQNGTSNGTEMTVVIGTDDSAANPPRESLSSESDSSLLELNSLSDTTSSILEDPAPVETHDRALLLVNEVDNEIGV